MLKKTSRITVDGDVIINDMLAARCYAMIDLENPSSITLTTRQLNIDICQDNRSELQSDVAEFEDYVHILRNKLLEPNETN